MPNEKRHIMLVDDFKDTRDMYAYFLSKEGFRVTLASDGQEALEKAVQLQPDLIIMDLSLPVISGWEVTRRLKADEKTCHIPIVTLSAYGEGFEAVVGCEGSLTKPCLPNVMVAEITRVLENHADSSRAGS
jgi:two-component system cell cycle response regulator DivK